VVYCDRSRRSPSASRCFGSNWRPDRERFLERDNLSSDVRRQILGLEGGVGSESGLHGRVGADERFENAGGTSISAIVAVSRLFIYVVLIILHPTLTFPPPKTSARLDSHARRRRAVL